MREEAEAEAEAEEEEGCGQATSFLGTSEISEGPKSWNPNFANQCP